MFEDLRNKIQDLDGLVIALLAQRFKLTQHIGEIKKQSQVRIEDKDREETLNKFYEDCAKKEGIDPSIIKHIYEVVLEESRDKQA